MLNYHKRTSDESWKIKTKHIIVSGLTQNHNAMKYIEYENLSALEKMMININLPKKVGVRCISALNDWKGNLLCRTNIGLIILWGVLQ